MTSIPDVQHSHRDEPQEKVPGSHTVALEVK